MRLRIIVPLLLVPIAVLSVACGGAKGIPGDSPTESYKRLYAAVKAHELAAIKMQITKQTYEFEVSAAKRAGKSTDDLIAAGCTETTYAETLPTIRDERIKGNMGAIEVWNGKDRVWEDLPYMLEDGAWKLAVAETITGKYKSPGPGRDFVEKQASNAVGTPSQDLSSSTVNRTPVPFNTPPKTGGP
jgi:hypothetical protein